MKIFKKYAQRYSTFLLVLLLLSCGTVTTLEVPNQKISVKAVGPLFEGVNTATANFNFKDLLPQNTDLKSIHSAKIQEFKLVPIVDEFPENKGFTALLASPNSSMQEFGFSSALKTDESNFKLAENQEFLIEILKDSSQTLVIDFTLTEDLYDNLEFEAEIKWSIQLKN